MLGRWQARTQQLAALEAVQLAESFSSANSMLLQQVPALQHKSAGIAMLVSSLKHVRIARLRFGFEAMQKVPELKLSPSMSTRMPPRDKTVSPASAPLRNVTLRQSMDLDIMRNSADERQKGGD